MFAYIIIVGILVVVMSAYAVYDWVKENKQAILDEAAIQRAVAKGRRMRMEQNARIMRPLDEALAQATAAVAKIPLRQATVVDGQVVVIGEDK